MAALFVAGLFVASLLAVFFVTSWQSRGSARADLAAGAVGEQSAAISLLLKASRMARARSNENIVARCACHRGVVSIQRSTTTTTTTTSLLPRLGSYPATFLSTYPQPTACYSLMTSTIATFPRIFYPCGWLLAWECAQSAICRGH